MTENNILFIEADEAIKTRLLNEWGEKTAHHMHPTDGFSIVALQEEILVGLISTYWRELSAPFNGEFDAYIDILEVHGGFKRKGIATQLIEISMKRAKEKGMRQIRAWSSEDTIEEMEPIHLPTEEEVRAAAQEGEEAVARLVAGLVKVIASFASRVIPSVIKMIPAASMPNRAMRRAKSGWLASGCL